MEVWYGSRTNEIYLKKGQYAEVGEYWVEWTGGGRIRVPNHLGLMRWKIKLRNWKRAVKRGLLVKVGKL